MPVVSNASSRHHARHARHRDPVLPRVRGRLRRAGHLRQARLRRGGDGRHAAGHPVRARRRAAVGADGRHRQAPPPARAPAARHPDRARPRRRGLRRPGRRVLRGARAPRRLAADDDPLHVPRDRDRGGGAARARAGGPAHGDRAGADLERAGAGAGGRHRRRTGPAGHRARADCRVPLHRLHPRFRRRDRPYRADDADHADLHRRRHDADPRRARHRRPRPRRDDPRRLRLGRRPGARLHRRRGDAVLRRDAPRRAVRGLDPLDRGAGGDEWRWPRPRSARRSGRRSSPAPRWCSPRCSPSGASRPTAEPAVSPA